MHQMHALYLPSTCYPNSRFGSPCSDRSDQSAADSEMSGHAPSGMYAQPYTLDPCHWNVGFDQGPIHAGPQSNGSWNMVSNSPHYHTPCYDVSLAASPSHYHPDNYTHLPSIYISTTPTYTMNDVHQYEYPTTPIYPHDSTTPVTTRCQWPGCDVELDDDSHAGIRRHFRQSHNAPRGTRMSCEWGGKCRSESMLFENIPKHIAECHLKTMSIWCPTCNTRFARKDTLKRHTTAGCPGAGHMHVAI